MTQLNLLLQALVTPNEHGIVRDAAGFLSSGLNDESKHPATMRVRFCDRPEDLDTSVASGIVIASVLDELDHLDEAWSSVEPRLRQKFGALCENGAWTLFVCTVLRQAGAENDRDTIRRRVRIRRLNMLIAELSRELGLFVVDIDRDLADIGARPLQTDWRLQGPYATKAAGKSVAMAVLLVGLDEFVPFATQTAARALVRTVAIETALETPYKPRLIGGPVVSVRTGKRRQNVETVMDTVDENFVASHINRLLKGHIGLHDAATVLMGSVSRRGWRDVSLRLFGGIKKVVAGSRLAKR